MTTTTPSHGKLAILRAAAAGAAIIVIVTTMTIGEITAADRAAEETAPLPQSSAGFSYFPEQYVNQGTEASEHIQAF